MSISRRTLGDVLKFLEENPVVHEIREEKLGNQTVITMDNEVIICHNPAEPPTPPTEAEKFKKMLQDLGFDESDEIDKQSPLGLTILSQSTIYNEENIAKVLLNYSADPSIADKIGNNAFIYAAHYGRGRLLQEFLSLIIVNNIAAAKKPEDYTIAANNSEPAPSAAIAKSTETPKGAQLISAEKTIAKPATPESLNQRVRLDASVLTRKNNAGEGAEQLIVAYKKKAQAKFQDMNLSDTAQTKDPLERFKKLAADLCTLQKEAAPVFVKPEIEKKPPVVEDKPYVPQPDKAYEEKYQKIRNTYDGFLDGKFTLYADQCKEALSNDSYQAEQTKGREKVRTKRSVYGNQEIPFSPTEPAMPAYYVDQARVCAVLDLLKDYYAPESASRFDFLGSNVLRRRMAFHADRRYIADAEKLHEQLASRPLRSVEDIMGIYEALNNKLDEVKEHVHDGKNKNSIYNSSYMRRLFCICETLKTTEAYTFTANNFPRDMYLDMLDIHNITRATGEFDSITLSTP